MDGENLPDWVRELTSALDEKMGLEVLEVAPERVVARMPVEGNTQVAGIWHGGASGVLVESLGSMGAYAHARTSGRIAVGTELNVTHHRAARRGWVIGTATALHLGRSVASYAVQLVDERDHLIASGRLSCMLIDAPRSR